MQLKRKAQGHQWGACLARFACLFLAPSGAVHALDPDRSVDQFPHAWYNDQLPQATVLAMVQRVDGSIWLATYGGLARYSGAEFEAIDRRTTPVLRSTAITALIEDRAGLLWVGTLNGGLYEVRGRTFEEVALADPMNSVFGLAQDSSGALWMATNAGIARRDGAGVHLFGTDSGFPHGPYRGIVADAEGGIWIAADGTGVGHWHDGRIDVLGVEQGLPSPAVYTLSIDSTGTLWVGTQSGLVRHRDGRFEREPKAAALDGQRIYALQSDRDGNLWIAAQSQGLCRLEAIRLDCASDLPGLGNEIVRSMLQDREGSLWIGTTNAGVHRISDSKLITITGAIASNSVRAVYEDAGGTLWLGTDGAGLARYQDQALVSSSLNTQLLSPHTRSLAGDAAGNLWVGSIEGLSRIGPDEKVHNFQVSDGLPGAIVFAIEPSHDGTVWAGTSRGLARVSADQVKAVSAAGGIDIRALHEDADGRLWIGLRSGLRCLRDNLLDNCGTDGLAETSFFAFHQAVDGGLWLGTSQGLMYWRDGKLTRYGERAGLFGDTVFTILDDGAGNFWLSSNRGIARLAQSDIAALDRGVVARIEPTWFDKSDGMLSSQGNGASQTPGWRGRDGRLWIGTTKGVVLIEPSRLRSNSLPPPVAIERISVDGRDVDPTHVVAMGPGVDRLEFHYAAMSYMAPEKVRYRYRLDGYDRDWLDAVDRRAAYYTNMPPGSYAFQVVASNNDGVWNSQGAQVAFSIRPRLPETVWFRVLLALAALVVVIGLYRFRLSQLRKHERELTREVALRTEELRAANAELRRFASLDGLTRITNRGAFDQALARLWDDHRRRGASLAVLLCDIDAFKAYNDSYGHVAGDAALIRVAATLQPMLRSAADVAARYGGEELVLLLADCAAEEVTGIARNLLDAVRMLAIEHRASNVARHITVSIGVAVLVPAAGQTPDLVVRRADAALYHAKARGRDRACGPDD